MIIRGLWARSIQKPNLATILAFLVSAALQAVSKCPRCR